MEYRYIFWTYPHHYVFVLWLAIFANLHCKSVQLANNHSTPFSKHLLQISTDVTFPQLEHPTTDSWTKADPTESPLPNEEGAFSESEIPDVSEEVLEHSDEKDSAIDVAKRNEAKDDLLEEHQTTPLQNAINQTEEMLNQNLDEDLELEAQSSAEFSTASYDNADSIPKSTAIQPVLPYSNMQINSKISEWTRVPVSIVWSTTIKETLATDSTETAKQELVNDKDDVEDMNTMTPTVLNLESPIKEAELENDPTDTTEDFNNVARSNDPKSMQNALLPTPVTRLEPATSPLPESDDETENSKLLNYIKLQKEKDHPNVISSILKTKAIGDDSSEVLDSQLPASSGTVDQRWLVRTQLPQIDSSIVELFPGVEHPILRSSMELEPKIMFDIKSTDPLVVDDVQKTAAKEAEMEKASFVKYRTKTSLFISNECATLFTTRSDESEFLKSFLMNHDSASEAYLKFSDEFEEVESKDRDYGDWMKFKTPYIKPDFDFTEVVSKEEVQSSVLFSHKIEPSHGFELETCSHSEQKYSVALDLDDVVTSYNPSFDVKGYSSVSPEMFTYSTEESFSSYEGGIKTHPTTSSPEWNSSAVPTSVPHVHSSETSTEAYCATTSIQPVVKLPPVYSVISFETTWKEFCNQCNETRNDLAKFFTSLASKDTKPSQIFFFNYRRHCNMVKRYKETNTESKFKWRPVNLFFFMTTQDQVYDADLTEIFSSVIKKADKHEFQGNSSSLVRKIIDVNTYFKGDTVYHPPRFQTTPIQPNNNGLIYAIAISSIASACLLILCVLLVVLRQRLYHYNQRCTPSSLDAYSLDSFSITASFRRRQRPRLSLRSFLNQAFEDPDYSSNPLNYTTLNLFCENKENIEKEFKKIPKNMPTVDQAIPGSEIKNRFANVIPISETRVVLTKQSTEEENSDYINANFVCGYGGKPKKYIACQAPLLNTISDFWRMIWEQDSRVILMVTLLEENGLNRCAPYFPESTLDSHQLHGDFQVSLQKREERGPFIVSALRVHELEKHVFRDVIHLWYIAWPPKGVLADATNLLQFLLAARPHIDKNPGPTIVHCSSGTGRTGVVIALDICMRELEETRVVDVLRCVTKIRRERGGLVQTCDQYFLIYEVLQEYCLYLSNQSRRQSLVAIER